MIEKIPRRREKLNPGGRTKRTKAYKDKQKANRLERGSIGGRRNKRNG